MQRLALAGLLAVASVALFVVSPALAQSRCGSKLCIGSKTTPLSVLGPLEIDARAANLNDGGPQITYTTRGNLDYDFPSLSGPGTALNTVCAESSAMTVTGCKFSDTVEVGVDQVIVNAFGTITGYVSAADAVKIRACATGITDGGSFNMPDANYTARCVR